MARHVLAGRWTPYFYGQEYFGSLEALLGAPLVALLGDDPLALRLVAIGAFAAFLSLHAAWVRRHWGALTAAASVLFLALPSFLLLAVSFRPLVPWTGLALGQALLWAAPDRGARVGPGRWLLLGLLVGAGLWLTTLSLVYAATVGLVAALRSDWLPRPTVRAAAAALAALAVTLLFFSAGCRAEAGWPPLAPLGAGLALAAALTLVAGAGPARRWPRAAAAVWTIGLLAGSAPAWASWLMTGRAPTSGISPSCPTGIPARLGVLAGVVPSLWGVPPVDLMLTLPLPEAAAWAAALALMLAALVFFALSQPGARRALALARLERAQAPAASVAVLFALPLLLSALGGNTLGGLSARYLVATWQASSIALAVLLVRVAGRAPLVALLLGLFWLLQVGAVNALYLRGHWEGGRRFAREGAVALLDFLAARDARAGFADYWVAYPLDFLTGERLTLAPYRGIDRYPPYSEAASAAPLYSYVFDLGALPPEVSTTSGLADWLAREDPDRRESAPPRLLERLRRGSLTERRAVGGWDVWLIRDRSGP